MVHFVGTVWKATGPGARGCFHDEIGLEIALLMLQNSNSGLAEDRVGPRRGVRMESVRPIDLCDSWCDILLNEVVNGLPALWDE